MWKVINHQINNQRELKAVRSIHGDDALMMHPDQIFSGRYDDNKTHRSQEQIESDHALVWLHQKSNIEPNEHAEDELTSKKPLFSNYSQTATDPKRYFMNAGVELLRNWALDSFELCSGNIWVYGSIFLVLHNVVLDPALAVSEAAHQNDSDTELKEIDEYYQVKLGFLTIPCHNPPVSVKAFQLTTEDRSLLPWVSNIKYEGTPLATEHVISGQTIAIVRHEYANVYWTMIDMYDVYIQMRFINATLGRVMFFDAHPEGSLYDLWRILFPGSLNLSSVTHKTKFKNLVLGFHRGSSPFLDRKSDIPLMGDFTEFILKRAGVGVKKDRLCSEKSLTVLFILRHDYKSHVRNKNGLIDRKISNEQELLASLNSSFPTWHIKGIQLDTLNIVDQIKEVANSDIMLGMHGAAFAFSFLMRPGSSVIELFPARSGTNWHMEFIATQSGHHYMSWRNGDPRRENKMLKSTKVPPHEIIPLLRSAFSKVCNHI